ncbi:P0 protein [White clover mottle virus]|uniref:p0 protein n=1 Tax=White clover mottle virus TaxID=1913024 RepID=A0A1J1DP29_9VIRU|nr:P0 protein [White clover mottle virus]BAV90573.1 P0 protein [White clover mottle virus]
MNFLINNQNSRIELTFSNSLSLDTRRSLTALFLISAEQYLQISHEQHGTQNSVAYCSLLVCSFSTRGIQFPRWQTCHPLEFEKSPPLRALPRAFGEGEFCILSSSENGAAELYSPNPNSCHRANLYRLTYSSLAEGLPRYPEIFGYGTSFIQTLIGSYIRKIERGVFFLRPVFPMGDSLGVDLRTLGFLLLDGRGYNNQYHAYYSSRIANVLHRIYGKSFTLAFWRLLQLDCGPCFQVPSLPMEAPIAEGTCGQDSDDEGEDDEGVWEL